MVLERFRLTDKAAVITGAGRGIGAACAIAFAEAGADVVISSRTEEDLDQVAEQVAEHGRTAIAVPADLNDVDNLGRLVDAAKQEFGRLDVVVNNVGGTLPMPFMDHTPEFLEDAFHFNVTTAFALSKAAVPVMLDNDGGSIVNIASIMGRVRERGFVGYGTAKAAMIHMTRLMAADLAPRIRVNAIAVGSVATSALDIVMTNDDLKKQMEDKTPLRRIGDPEEVAAGALYLASDGGSYTTGKVLEIDGGLEEANLSFGLPDL